MWGDGVEPAGEVQRREGAVLRAAVQDEAGARDGDERDEEGGGVGDLAVEEVFSGPVDAIVQVGPPGRGFQQLVLQDEGVCERDACEEAFGLDVGGNRRAF